MIDIYPRVFTTLQTSLASTATVSNVEQLVTDTFPYVTVQEISNLTYTESQDNQLTEHHARVGYAINVYSNVSDTEARSIMATVDSLMQNMKFTRTQMQPTPNIDHTVHRYTATYEAVVAEPVTSGSDTIYQMYRR